MCGQRWVPTLILVLFAILCSSGSARQWVDSKGRKIEADFVRLEGDEVLLRKAGKLIRIELSKFSAEDQQYVKDKTAAQKQNPGGVQYDVPTSVPQLNLPQQWIDRDGNKVTAVFVYANRDTVSLRVGFRPQSYSYLKFSDANQRAIRYYMESKGQGLQVPRGTDDLSGQSARSWTGQDSTRQYGILRQVKPGSKIVIQLAKVTATYPFDALSEGDQEYLREAVADDEKLAALLPLDKSIRTWTDWKGETFSAKLDPAYTRYGFSSTIRFKLGKNQFYKSFMELGLADRNYLRQLAKDQNKTASFPKPFTDPGTEVRTWEFKRSGKEEGQFVRMDGTYVVLRTARSSEQKKSLADFTADDRALIEGVLKARGEADLYPVLKDDCRSWIYGPNGQGSVIAARFENVSRGIVTLALPESGFLRGKPAGKKYEVAFACLSPGDQKLVRDNLPSGTASSATSTTVSKSTLGIKRNWTLRSGNKHSSKKLMYLRDDSVGIGSGDKNSYQWVMFRDLVAADQDHVRRELAAKGASDFKAPPAPPRSPRITNNSSRRSPSPPRSTTSIPSMSMGYKCSKCGHVVYSARAGQKCPRCRAVWTHVDGDAGSSTTSKTSSKRGSLFGMSTFTFGVTLGSIFLILFTIIAVFVVLKVVGWA